MTAPHTDDPSPHLRLLLVDDDALIRAALGLALADENCRVIEADSGERALAVLETTAVDLVLLDVVLPGMSGLTLCRMLRARGDLPIILVTARDDTPDVLAGFEAGADDYVTKPLVASELAARVRALLRRAHTPPSTSRQVLRLGELTIRLDTRVVRKRDRLIRLTPTEFRLLTELAEAAGTVVRRERLLDRVWGPGYARDDRVLDAHVRRLRHKVEADPDRPELVRTVRGIGYQGAAPASGPACG
ncbi:DNA-binding response OmpR family regulator [Crossiella equi]|uniref:DNA-binding response OmpR family regulator n=1 Tax=Crossiella equi TaxID=130796 RepID=A0ABS5ASN0_9PSEU|nr:response regulator transcription factor [Crossiella equi]MBP2479568.1 DNA-binding response OmpR family regulator [Crossiella equi]